MKKIKIAQLGIGHNHGSAKMDTLRKYPDLFEIVGVSETSPEWRKKRQNLDTYKGIPFMEEEELLNVPGLEAVAIETDGMDLLPTALRCAERGLHIHMDKPGGHDLEQYRVLCDMCKEKHLAFQMAYIYRYNAAVKFMLNAIRNDWIGEIFEIHAVMSRYDGDDLPYRKWMSQFPGGAMYIFAGYLIDIILQILGTPDKVHSFMKQTRNDGLVDNGLAVLEYPKATATVRVSIEEVGGMQHRRFIICGTKGTMELCPIEHQDYYNVPLMVRMNLKHPCGTWEAGEHMVDCGPLGGRYDEQVIEFAKIIRGELVNPYPMEHEFMIQKILLQSCGLIPG